MRRWSEPEGPALAIIVCYCGHRRWRARAAAFGAPVADTTGPSPYARIQNLLREVRARRLLSSLEESGFFRSFSDDAIERLVDFFAADVPSPLAAVAIYLLEEQQRLQLHSRARLGLILSQ